MTKHQDNGTGHWIAQRISAVALIPLSIWFVIALINLNNYAHTDVLHWLSQPLNSVLMYLYAQTMLYHAYLGIQVIIEDYVSSPLASKLSLNSAKAILLLAGTAVTWAILKI